MEAISLSLNGDVINIRINGLIHLSFKRSNLIGFQAYKEDRGLWSIEFYFKDGPAILAEYDKRERWVDMLKVIEEGCLLQLDKV